MSDFLREGVRILLPTTVGLVFTMLAFSDAWGQQVPQKHQVSYQVSAENSKFTQQHVIAVGDMPEHQLRLFEIDRSFPTNAPMFDGVQVREVWTRGLSDYTDTNGPATAYNEYVLENGDKVFTRVSLVAQNVVSPDGSRKNSSTSAGLVTGGTGKFLGIRGTMRSSSLFDAKAGKTETQVDIEYWIEK